MSSLVVQTPLGTKELRGRGGERELQLRVGRANLTSLVADRVAHHRGVR
jgi:hypothetical protein